MAVAVETTFPGGTTEQYDEGIKLMGLTSGGRHPGAMFHWVAKTDSGIRVTDVWATKEEFERFLQEQVLPVVEQAGLPTPDVRFIEVHNYMTAA